MSDELAHHGVKGMKWGVWNSETAARRAGVRQKTKNVKNTGSIKNRLPLDRLKALRAVKGKEREEPVLSKEQIEKLRKTTLESNDPETVQKGMHLLTDEELRAKVDRMEQEARVRRLVYSNQKSEAEIKRIKNEARQKTLGYDIAKSAGTESIKAVTKPIKNLSPKKAMENEVKKGIKKPFKKAVKESGKAVEEALDLYRKKHD